MDVFGRVVQVDEETSSATWSTTYEHDVRGDLTGIRDTLGNVTAMTYDWLGRRLSLDDPDAGLSTTTYSAATGVTVTENAMDDEVATFTDAIGRVTEQTDNVSTVWNEYDYDATGELGLLDEARSKVGSGWYVVDTVGYDGRNRPTGFTYDLPSSVTSLDTAYTIGFEYDRADHQTVISYPAMGGLAAEDVITVYDTLGYPDSLTVDQGSGPFTVAEASYNDIGLLVGLDYPAATAVAEFYYFGDTRLLQNVYRSVGSQDIHDAYIWDSYSNLEQQKRMGDMLTQAEHELQCFKHDDRNRLIEASLGNWDVPCDDPWDPSGPTVPYRQTFAYDEIHNITAKTDDDGTNPPVTSTYTYPTSGLGVEQPHAPTSIGGVSHTWDDAGRLTASGSDSYGWDLFGRLETATVSGTATTNVYDTAGQRVVHEIDAAGGSTPDEIVYTVGGATELTYTAATTSTGARRYYEFAGKTVLTTTDDPTSAFLWDNHQGTNTIAIDSTGVHQLDYYPYGATRDTTPYPNTTRTFLGQHHDTTTGLAYLNARHYNPTAGIFLSPDPIALAVMPASLNAYIYGYANPTTLSDSSGLCSQFSSDGDGNWTCAFYNMNGSTWVTGGPGQLTDCYSTAGYAGCGSPPPKPKGSSGSGGFGSGVMSVAKGLNDVAQGIVAPVHVAYDSARSWQDVLGGPDYDPEFTDQWVEGYEQLISDPESLVDSCMADVLRCLTGVAASYGAARALKPTSAATNTVDDIVGLTDDYIDITAKGSRVRNVQTSVSRSSFEQNLIDAGYQRRVSTSGPNVVTYELNGARYVVRDAAKSTGGPTADFYPGGSDVFTLKIRLAG